MELENSWESEVEQLLEEMYPDRWDRDRRKNHPVYYIYYPRFNITNSVEQSHEILNLYIKLQFYEDGSLSDIYGTRSLLSQAEKQSNYPHSHLSNLVVTNGQWGGFCFGTGPISKEYNNVRNEFDIFNFEVFLHSLDIFLLWESIESGPYQYISGIIRNTEPSHVPSFKLEDIYKRFIDECANFDFTIINNSEIKVSIIDDDLMDQITPLLDKEHRVFRTEGGEYYTDGADNEYCPVDLHFEFKGKKIYQTVYNDNDNEAENTRKEYPNPDITKYIAKKLSRRLTLHALAKRGSIGRNTESHIIGGVMVQDM